MFAITKIGNRGACWPSKTSAVNGVFRLHNLIVMVSPEFFPAIRLRLQQDESLENEFLK